MMIEPIIGADGVFCVQSIQFLFLYNVVSTLTHITSLPFRIGKVVCLFLGHALLHEIVHHFKDIHFLQRLFFGLYRHFRFTLFHNIGIMAVDVGNQLGGSAVDGFKACTKLFQLLVFRPCCNIAEAVFTGCDAVVGTHGKGNAFSLDFLGVAVFLLLGLELIGGDFAAHKVQPLVLCEPQRPALGNIQRFCRKNGTGVIDYHALLDGYGIAGVIVGTTQIIAI